MGAVVLFALLLFVMGGVTAYMGDRLGSYIGKKRHSTFGLRPRHTAMLWTVVSGGVISVGTLLLFLALNGTFKTALIRGPQLLAANAELSLQDRSLAKRNAAAERSAAADGALAKDAQARAESAQAKAAQAQATLAAVSGQLGRAKATLTQSRAALTHRQAALAAAQTNLASARAGLGSTRAELSQAQASVRQARVGVRVARRQYQLATDQVVQANKSVLQLVVEQDALHGETAKLTRENQAQQSLLQASQGRTLIFRREQELGRTVVAARQDEGALRRELAAFLDQVELTARQRGAGGLDNAPAIAIPAFGDTGDTGPAAREAALDALSQNIAAQGDFMPSIVVVAEARYNTFKGESVKLDLRPYANILVFPKGAVIAQGVVDGTQPEDVILRQVQAFLTNQVRAAALQRGIIPVHDPQSGEPLVGQPIDSATWLGLVKQIQQAGAGAKITTSAAKDTYSADLVSLDFNVTAG